jgi:hypothetical protein
VRHPESTAFGLLDDGETAMRFAKMTRWEAFQDTTRKRHALARKQRLERERSPLLAPLIAEAQPPADAVMAERATRWTMTERLQRQRRAAAWRRARAKLYAHGPHLRAALRQAWNRAPYPADPHYLADMLHGFEVGRLAFGDDGQLYTAGHLAWLANKPRPIRERQHA